MLARLSAQFALPTRIFSLMNAALYMTILKVKMLKMLKRAVSLLFAFLESWILFDQRYQAPLNRFRPQV